MSERPLRHYPCQDRAFRQLFSAVPRGCLLRGLTTTLACEQIRASVKLAPSRIFCTDAGAAPRMWQVLLAWIKPVACAGARGNLAFWAAAHRWQVEPTAQALRGRRGAWLGYLPKGERRILILAGLTTAKFKMSPKCRTPLQAVLKGHSTVVSVVKIDVRTSLRR